MTTSSDTISGISSRGQLSGQSSDEGQPYPRFQDALKKVAEILWPENTPAHVAYHSGYSFDHAKAALRDKRGINAERGFRIAFSGADDGLIIETYIESLPPSERDAAWTAVKAALDRVELRQRIEADRAALEQLNNRVSELRTRRR